MLLSVCIVTQNQAARLPPLLDQASAIGDEVVVVDGGSQDDTPQVVARYPKARLLHRAFDGNIAVQKNYALDAARGQWLLILDTDELLGPNLVRLLPALLRTPFRTIAFPRYWLVREDPPEFVDSPDHYPDRQMRLFRNLPELRYDPAGAIHHVMAEAARPKRLRLRLHHAHLLHYCFLWQDRATRAQKVREYDVRHPEMAAVNKVYMYEDHPHQVRRCREAWVRGQPYVACGCDYWRERVTVALKRLQVTVRG